MTGVAGGGWVRKVTVNNGMGMVVAGEAVAARERMEDVMLLPGEVVVVIVVEDEGVGVAVMEGSGEGVGETASWCSLALLTLPPSIPVPLPIVTPPLPTLLPPMFLMNRRRAAMMSRGDTFASSLSTSLLPSLSLVGVTLLFCTSTGSCSCCGLGGQIREADGRDVRGGRVWVVLTCAGEGAPLLVSLPGVLLGCSLSRLLMILLITSPGSAAVALTAELSEVADAAGEGVRVGRRGVS